MKLKLPIELLILNAVSILLAIIIALLPLTLLRLIVGLPFLIFSPGYVLVAALFPRKNQISAIERVGYSFGFSIAILPLIGLLINYTPWGVRLNPVLISISLYVLTVSIIAWYRWYSLPEAERFQVNWKWRWVPWQGERGIDKVLSSVLIAAIIATISVFGYTIYSPKTGERFTEFYVMGAQGKVADYPKELALGKEASVMVGITNREQVPSRYKIVVTLDGHNVGETQEVTLKHNEKWEQELSFIPNKTGVNLKLEFLLFRDGGAQPYQKPLHLWVTVKE